MPWKLYPPNNNMVMRPPSTHLPDASIMRTCAGQLAWVANATRPDQAFLASYLQGIQQSCPRNEGKKSVFTFSCRNTPE